MSSPATPDSARAAELAPRLRVNAERIARVLSQRAVRDAPLNDPARVEQALQYILQEIAHHLEHGVLEQPERLVATLRNLWDLGMKRMVGLLGELRNEVLSCLLGESQEVPLILSVLTAVQAILDLVSKGGPIRSMEFNFNHEPELLPALDQMNVAVWRAGPDSRLLYLNKAGARMLGARSPQELFGVPFASFYLDPEERDRIRETVISRGSVVGERLHARRFDGQSCWLETNFCARYDESHQLLGFEGYGRDITPWIEAEDRARQLHQLLEEERQHHVEELERQVRERTEELELANQELQILNKMKDQLFANVSHELRAPLVSGLGYVELVLEGGMGRITRETRRGLSSSRRNLRALLTLIDNLLDSVKSSVFVSDELPSTPFPLAPLLEECVVDLQSCSSKPIELVVELPPDLPLIDADREGIRRVFTNLLSNAEKFTRDSARIAIVVRRCSPTRAEVRLSDDGFGLPAADQTLIFEQFFRSKHSEENAVRGLGLGLSIVKKILAIHGCTVRAEPNAGQGTTFVFELPLLNAMNSEAK